MLSIWLLLSLDHRKTGSRQQHFVYLSQSAEDGNQEGWPQRHFWDPFRISSRYLQWFSIISILKYQILVTYFGLFVSFGRNKDWKHSGFLNEAGDYFFTIWNILPTNFVLNLKLGSYLVQFEFYSGFQFDNLSDQL